MDRDEIFRERWKRINDAIEVKRPDRVPVVLSYALWASRVTGFPYREFCVSVKKSGQKMIDTFDLCGNADGLEFAGYNAYGNCFLFLY